jgi:hypothetical protein
MTPDTAGPGFQAPLAPALAQLRNVMTSARAFDPSRGHVSVDVACPD